MVWRKGQAYSQDLRDRVLSADGASRAHYYESFREAAERARIGWAIWDWKAGFHYWNEKTGRPEPGMRQALFGRAQAGPPR